MALNLSSALTLLDQNDVPESANEPGPGHYFGPESVGFSALGKQKFSKCASAPEVSLPKTGWDNWEKVIVSKAHEGTGKCRTSGGALYEVGSELNKLTTKFGTSLRPDLAASLGVDPAGSPGPAYNLRDCPAAQICDAPPPRNRANKSFGGASRFNTDLRTANIGPGQYRRKDVALRGDTGRSISTGRQAWEKVITPGWEVEGRCRASPGIGPPNWTNINKHGSRAMSIGKAERFPRTASESCSPGPIYNQGEREVSNKKQYVSDTKTATVVPFAKPAKKPRFRQQLAANMPGAKHGMWGYF
eukprot:TRINITY_DN40039_c0_g1_i1.p1 TRINITY_DN40039_c0_g1~~TRINITY_DN40039_c0_g1_i1.p1  ORF type:complete len:315 (-),score=54.95 TRINITY_DN40039_c0_g1_i1:81-986(-)